MAPQQDEGRVRFMNGPARWHRRRVLLALPTVGCSALVRRSDAYLERRFETHGLSLYRAEIDGAVLEYWLGGSGAPLVFLHGFGPPAHWQWPGQVVDFVDDYRIIVPNLLWFGDSIDRAPHFELDRQAEIIAALLEQLDARNATIVGISYGGFVAYRLAVLQPHRVGSLVLVGSPAGVYDRTDYEQMLAHHGVDDAVELFVPSDGDGVERLLRLAYWREPLVPDALDAAAADVLYTNHRDEKAQLLRHLVANIEASQHQPVPQVPALVIWGEHDTVFPPALGRKLAGKLHADFIVVPKARHGPNAEHVARFNRILRAWLERGEN